MIYIFDIDGTLADISHRLHFIGADKGGWISSTNTSKDWESFYKACVDDKPILETINIARALAIWGDTIVYSTGRSTDIFQETRTWLESHGLPYARIYMRPDGDHREDCVVKSELLDMIMEDYKYGGVIAGAFEDRQQVVDMYRARGIRVFQVAEGKF